MIPEWLAQICGSRRCGSTQGSASAHCQAQFIVATWYFHWVRMIRSTRFLSPRNRLCRDRQRSGRRTPHPDWRGPSPFVVVFRKPTRCCPGRQIAIREHGSSIDNYAVAMMRLHGLGLWIVATKFHDDPLVQYVAPPRPYTGNRDLFVFIDAGDAGLKKFAITGYTEESLSRFFDAPFSEPRPPAATLRALHEQYHPQSIGLGIRGSRGQTRTLTHDTYRFLAETLGPAAESTFVGASNLVQEYLDTRLPDEMEHYPPRLRSRRRSSSARYSNAVITPEKTTVGVCDARSTNARPQVSHVVSAGFARATRHRRRGPSRGFLAVAPEATVIRRGDVVHVIWYQLMGFDPIGEDGVRSETGRT